MFPLFRSIPEHKTVKLLRLVSAIGLFIVIPVYFGMEGIKLAVLRKSYFRTIVTMFQTYLFLSLLPVLSSCIYQIASGDPFSLRRFLNVNALLAVSGNLLLSLSSSSIFGKYILMMVEAGKTLIRLLFPLFLLLGCLAACQFILRFKTTIDFYLQNLDPSNITDENKLRDFCFNTEPIEGSFKHEELNHYWKAFLAIVNGMYGQTDTKYMTDRYVYMDDFDVRLDPTSVILWLIVTLLTTVLFMNILLGLTIGDIKRCATMAHCCMVQKSIHELQIQAILDDTFFCIVSIFKKCSTCCRDKTEGVTGDETKYDIIYPIIIYPNKWRKGCPVEEVTGFWVRFSKNIQASYILGCKKVRKRVRANCPFED